MSLFEQVGSLLDYRVVRELTVPGINYLARRRNRGVYRISYDQGVWIHKTLHGYFAYPHPFIRLNLADFDSFTRVVFFRAYCPKDGDVIVDVGAGAGEETLTFSRAVCLGRTNRPPGRTRHKSDCKKRNSRSLRESPLDS